MSKASYWQRGETLDYKNTGSSTIEANTVVELTGRVGIAGTDIAPGAEGDLHVCGVFEFDKTGTNESHSDSLFISTRQASQTQRTTERLAEARSHTHLQVSQPRQRPQETQRYL